MPDKRWKATERRIAGLLGGRRVLVSGRGRGDQPDVAHPWLALEVKDRATRPLWLLDALAQAEASATDKQQPVAVWHRAGTGTTPRSWWCASHLARTWWVLPPFDDRPPLVVCVGMGGSVAPAVRRRNVIADGQQCAPLVRKSRMRISERRQDGIITMHHFGLTRTTRVEWESRRRRDRRV